MDFLEVRGGGRLLARQRRGRGSKKQLHPKVRSSFPTGEGYNSFYNVCKVLHRIIPQPMKHKR